MTIKSALSVVLLTLAMSGLVMGQKNPGRSKPVQISANSLLRKLKPSNMKPGDNLVLKQRNGTSIYAVFSNGKITGWKATDLNGNALPIRVTHDSSYTECWYCCGPPEHLCDINCYNDKCK